MDLFALGTPVIDLFARASDDDIARLGLKRGATHYFSAKRLSSIEKKLGRKLGYSYPGDNARNVCEGFAALGGFCGFAGAIGADRAGASFAASLHECGISDFLQERKGSTGRILCLVTPDGQRTFCADLGVSTRCARVEKIAVREAKMLYVSSITLIGKSSSARLAARYMEAFRKAKKRVAISIENPPMVAHHRDFLLSMIKKYADFLFLNEDEADALLGKGDDGSLLLLKPKIPVYLKRGAAGSSLFLSCSKRNIDALRAKVADTTGAGDAYAAGTLYGICRGYSPFSSAKIGTYLATKVVGKFGAGIPLKHIRMRREGMASGKRKKTGIKKRNAKKRKKAGKTK